MKFIEPYPHLSTTNSKLGNTILGINLPAGLTCRANAPCRKGCYANKGHFKTANVVTGLEGNLNAFLDTPDYYFNKIIMTLTGIPFRHFRWHSSGDIVNKEYLLGMIKVANECQATEFLCFTKKYELVNDYITEYGDLPKNLHIVFSHWLDFPVPNPHNLPTSHVRFPKVNSNIPDRAFECPGFCGDCVTTETHCWNLRKGEAVVFDKH